MRYRAYLLFAVTLLLPHLASAQDEIITGTRTLSQETIINVNTITFKDQSLIITNGFKLTLNAKTKIVFEGVPRIVSFAPQTNRPAGDPGRSAGPIIIQTPRLDGTTLKIEDVGEDGTDGANGAPGQQGPRGQQGTQRDWNPWNGCIGGSNGTPGGQGGDGGNGGHGGNGGGGGAIVFAVAAGFYNGVIARLDMKVIGGKAGAAGNAGAPGPGGPGGEGAPGTFHCGGTDPGGPGPSGRSGLAGVSGSQGNAGTIVDVNGNSLPTSLSSQDKALYLRSNAVQ